MINLSELTDAEMAQIKDAFLKMDDVLCMLERAKIISEEGCDLLEIFEATQQELIIRSIEHVDLLVQS